MNKIILAMLLVPCVAFSNYSWEKVTEVQTVVINVTVVSLQELVAIQQKQGTEVRPDPSVRSAWRWHSPEPFHKGQAVLYKDNGKYHCDVYLLSENDKDTLSHEKLHCYGWKHK